MTNCNYKHGLMLTCRKVHVRPHCFILIEACSCRLELAYFAGKISKNRLVCKNAVALAYYGPYDPTTATATWDFFTSGCVLRMSIFLRRRYPFPRGRREALFDVVRKRGINQTEAWQRNQGKNETLRLNLKKISLYDMSETNRAWSLLYTTTN